MYQNNHDRANNQKTKIIKTIHQSIAGVSPLVVDVMYQNNQSNHDIADNHKIKIIKMIYQSIAGVSPLVANGIKGSCP